MDVRLSVEPIDSMLRPSIWMVDLARRLGDVHSRRDNLHHRSRKMEHR
jgi:hypothetical protein